MSEVVAFILVFAVILISVGLLYATAFQSMHSYQEVEQVRSAAQGMEALASNFNDVQRQGGTEQRSGELTLRDGTVRTGGEGTDLIIRIGDDVYDFTTGSLTYQYGSSMIAYEGGGLFRGIEGEDGRSVVTSRPALICSEGRDDEEGKAVISLLVLDSEGERSIQASGTRRFTFVENDLDKVDVESETFSDANCVSIEVRSSPHASGWEDVFRGGDWSWTGGSTLLVSGAATISPPSSSGSSRRPSSSEISSRNHRIPGGGPSSPSSSSTSRPISSRRSRRRLTLR